ncbi:inositol phosphate phosphatase SopB [Pseudomonas putida]|uniref:inositol phosphate phosphatase SopB n=1 Tax=Pseudomonas putida TaxID=303 RepID=UPI003D958158
MPLVLTRVPATVDCLPGDERAPLSELEKSSSPPPLSIQTLFVLQKNRVEAAAFALDQLGKDTTALKHISDQLQSPLLKVDRTATNAELKKAKSLDKDMIAFIASHLQRPGITSKALMREARTAFISARQAVLNRNEWKKVETSFEHNNQRYTCTMLPAAQMKLGDEDIFPTSYCGRGVTSASTLEIRHATNLWTSEIRAQEHDGREKTLFKGVRHGTLSPYGLEKGSAQRHLGAQNRAREVVTAALFARPESLKLALTGNVVPLQLVSTSLLTGGFGGEGDMLDDQIRAWQELCQMLPLVLSLIGDDGKPHAVRVNLEVAAFNFGVNEFALKFHMGNTQADGYNVNAFHQLLGSDLRPSATPGGWVGEYLKRDPRPVNANRVELLSRQLKEIWAGKTHNRDGGEPYKAALRAAMLAYEIGAVPCWNCKSGKDRTGMLDVELKREAVALHQNRELALGSPLTEDHQQLLRQALLHGGNFEVQTYNTGAPGNKVMIDVPVFGLSNRSRVGDDEAWNQAKGLSRLV